MGNNLINGRTPEEIKQGLRCDVPCGDCAYQKCALEDDNGCSPYVERDVLALIERLEAERDAALAKVPKWISVEDKLPEKECKVLVYIGACNIAQGWYLGDGVFEVGIGAKFNAKSAFDRIVLPYWMPLPEPPEEGE